MDKKEWLDKLYYEIGKQQHNFELTSLTKEGAKSKWKKYLDVQADENFIKNANNRTILPSEIVIDLEEADKFPGIFERLKKTFKFYSAYKTGSRGYHIHLFFDRNLEEKEKLSIIKRFNGDIQKTSRRCMIALENCPHWKTGNDKTLIEENFGYNSASEIDFTKEYFNFDVAPVTIEETLKIVESNFPKTTFTTEACLSVSGALLVEDLANPIGLNLEGAPSSEKTTILSFFYGIEDITFKSDLFTPKSFVSHSANVQESELEKIDLLPKIKNKVFIVPELAPIFGKRKEDLVENLSILTRIFDGEGFECDSGVRGHRGYTGDYRFMWLGATTPLPTHIWNVMGKLGQRFWFLKIPDKNKTNEDLKEVMTDISYKKKIETCRKAIHNFVKYKFNHAGSLYSIAWNKEKDDEQIKNLIVSLAKIVSSLRAPIEIYSSGYDREEFQFKTPVKEEPERAISHLYDIARGHAVLYDRNYLTMNDARVICEIALSSCPFERYKLLELFLKAGKYNLGSYEIAHLLKCSEKNARTIMKTMEILGLGTIEEFTEERAGAGRPSAQFILAREYSDLLVKLKELRREHGVNSASEINNGSETDGVSNENMKEIQINDKELKGGDEDVSSIGNNLL